jgi:hypothetical protein
MDKLAKTPHNDLMSKDTFSLIYFGLAAIFAIWFLRRGVGERRKPNQLHLDSRDSVPTILKPETSARPDKVPQQKKLNFHFIYNGHSWEAYEVLGLTPGASVEAVEEAYKKSLATSDPQSHDFMTTAYEAIIKGTKGKS